MNVLSLFDGYSGGLQSLKGCGIHIDNYFASEIDKYAMQIAKKNHTEIVQVGDVTKIKVSDYPKIDLLIGGSPCFVGETPIICINEIKPIQNIKIGDYVLTHLDRYNKVVAIGGENKNIFSLHAQGGLKTLTTSNHPYFIRNRIKVWDKIKKSHKFIFDEPKWVNVEDICIGNFVGTPIINTEKNPFNLSKEECFILGLYIGDGHTRKDYKVSENRPNDRNWQLILSIGSKKKDTLLKQLSFKYSCYKHTNGVHRIVFSNKKLVELCEQNCGIGAINKSFSKMILDLPVDLLKEVLRGYEFTDGSERKNCVRITTISLSMIQSIPLVIAKVYKTTCCIEFTERPKTTVIEGRKVNQQNTYTVSYRRIHPKKSRSWIIDGVVWNPIKSIVNTGVIKKVFNIEVDCDNSYVANNHIVHNCQGFSFAGKQLNFNDPRSALFFEYVRILNEIKETNPDVIFLLENVKMKKEYQDIISDLLGVQPIEINSALVSAQNRRRLYWTNIVGITQPLDRGIVWGDVREIGVDSECYYYTEKAMQWLGRSSRKKNKVLTIHNSDDKMQMLEASHSKKYSNQRFFGIVDLPNNNQVVAAMRGRYLIDGKRQDGNQLTSGLTKQYIEFRYDGKTNCITTVGKDNIVVPFTLPNRTPADEFFFRYITPIECERLMGLPDNYTDGVSNSQRYKMLGNGWQIDTIKHIFSYLK